MIVQGILLLLLAVPYSLAAASLRQCKTITAHLQLLHASDFTNTIILPSGDIKTVDESFPLQRIRTANCAQKLEKRAESFEIKSEKSATRKVVCNDYGWDGNNVEIQFNYEKFRNEMETWKYGEFSAYKHEVNFNYYEAWSKHGEITVVKSFHAQPTATDAIKVCWQCNELDSPRWKDTKVELRYREASENCKIQKWSAISAVESKSLCYEVKSLAADTTYEFGIKIHKTAKWSEKPIFGRTKAIRPWTPPQEINILETTKNNTVILKWTSWQPSCGNNVSVGYYYVYFGVWNTLNGKYEWKRKRVEVNASTTQISNLAPNTKYYFTVQAVNRLGSGMHSPVHSYTTRSY